MHLHTQGISYEIANKLAKIGKTLSITAAVCLFAGAAMFLFGCSGDINADNPNFNNQNGKGPNPVNLGTASGFAVLSKSGVSTVPTSLVTGDVGVSPIDQTAITGFSFVMDASNVFATSPQVIGQIFAADFSVPTPANMTTAVSDMETAYTTAAGLTVPAPVTELGAGDISGLTIAPGLYKWGTGVSINTDVTLQGGPNDVWVFQISGGLTQAAATKVKLVGGAQAKNIFWQSFGVVTIGTTAVMNGTILAKTSIDALTGATVNGKLLSQTAVTLDQATVTIH